VSTPIFRDEAEMVDSLIEIAQALGWRVCHFRPARTEKGYRTALQGDAGFPDLVLARNGVVHIWECKMEHQGFRGRLSPAQRAWMDALGDKARVLYPADYDWAVEQLATLGKE